jgi:Right handed beta helix region
MKPLRLPYHILPILYGVYIAVTLLQPVTAQGATYYVATTGNDSNSGTSSSPWRHPQRCINSPIKPGDTCIVRSGTYTDTNGDGVVVRVFNRTTTVSGTASQPITIKSEKPQGAVIIVPSNKNGWGFLIERPYYVIEGFDITGGNYSGSSGAGTGISVLPGGNGVTIRSNSIHHIGRSACTNSTNSYSGVVVKAVSGVLVERNRIYVIGRRLNGESGCSTTKTSHDHGIYVTQASNATVRRNVFYDATRGYPIHVYSGTTTNLNIYHNTFSGRNSKGNSKAHILLGSTIRTANIKNNISNDAPYGMVWANGVTASGVIVSHNMSNTVVNATAVFKLATPGITFSSNFEKLSNLGFANKSTNDFRLVSGSPAINRGTTSGIPPVPDGAPDTSAYEYSSQNSLSSPLTPTGLSAS